MHRAAACYLIVESRARGGVLEPCEIFSQIAPFPVGRRQSPVLLAFKFAGDLSRDDVRRRNKGQTDGHDGSGLSPRRIAPITAASRPPRAAPLIVVLSRCQIVRRVAAICSRRRQIREFVFEASTGERAPTRQNIVARGRKGVRTIWCRRCMRRTGGLGYSQLDHVS